MNSHDRRKGAEPVLVVGCGTSGEGPLGGGEEAGPPCGALWSSQLTAAALALFDGRGLTNGRQEAGTSDAVTCSFSVRILKMLCAVVS